MVQDYDVTKPDDHTLNSAWPDEVRNVKLIAVGDGIRLYYAATAPATRYDGTAFATQDLGSMWIDSDDNKLYILTVITPTWTDFETIIEAMTLGLSAVLTQAEAPVFTKGIVANDAFLVGRNNADDGNADIVRINTADLPELADGTVLDAATEVGDGARTVVDKAFVDMSAYTTNDSTPATMLKSVTGLTPHSYLAVTDGFVAVTIPDMQVGEYLKCYVDSTDDPKGNGILVQDVQSASTNKSLSAFFAVSAGEYFEITVTSGTPVIRWKSCGVLSAPVDQD